MKVMRTVWKSTKTGTELLMKEPQRIAVLCYSVTPEELSELRDACTDCLEHIDYQPAKATTKNQEP